MVATTRTAQWAISCTLLAVICIPAASAEPAWVRVVSPEAASVEAMFAEAESANARAEATLAELASIEATLAKLRSAEATSAKAASAGEVEDLSELSVDDFRQRMRDTPLIMVDFYAPWCPYCEALEPELEDAAHQLEKVPFAKVDCTSPLGREICHAYNVIGYPTIKIFRSGRPMSYDGDRTARDLVFEMRIYSGFFFRVD